MSLVTMSNSTYFPPSLFLGLLQFATSPLLLLVILTEDALVWTHMRFWDVERKKQTINNKNKTIFFVGTRDLMVVNRLQLIFRFRTLQLSAHYQGNIGTQVVFRYRGGKLHTFFLFSLNLLVFLMTFLLLLLLLLLLQMCCRL